MDYLPYSWTNHGITIYTAYISVDLIHNEIYHVSDGKGGISNIF